ncbi:hypothetical protein BDZ85DRAFT_281878 [Elsinoe ampelina]|uniref:Uncharacterized protein n=1 Tax=Elsinoe ampelina TaxID=302913 RepID=A0A6A6GB97_9PEZI|nr:hypothetical protein BDZ85DRAFT_281878 [Elsinoe ampelina]
MNSLQARQTHQHEADDKLKHRWTLTAILSCVVAGPINIYLMSFQHGTLFVSNKRARHALSPRLVPQTWSCRGVGHTRLSRTRVRRGVLTNKTIIEARANPHHRLKPRLRPKVIHSDKLKFAMALRIHPSFITSLPAPVSATAVPEPRSLPNSLSSLDLILDLKPLSDRLEARPPSRTQLLMQPPTRT